MLRRALGALIVLAASLGAAAEPAVPVVVELFTSQGCSSCPPADRLLSQLQRSQPVDGVEIIALSQHVDYWNDLGWTDPFSSETFTLRQSAYAVTFRQASVYTPQMVVDGTSEFVGGDRARALNEIARAGARPKARLALRTLPVADGPSASPGLRRLSIDISGLKHAELDQDADVVLAILEDRLSTRVERGENARRELRQDCVVRDLRRVGEIGPAADALSLDAVAVEVADDWIPENLRAVAFAQERRSRRVLAAASIPLTPQRGQRAKGAGSSRRSP